MPGSGFKIGPFTTLLQTLGKSAACVISVVFFNHR